MNTPSVFSIRPTQAADASVLSALACSLAHFYLTGTSPDLPTWLAESLSTEAFSQRLHNSDFQHWLGLYDNLTVGFIALYQGSHLYHLFVAEHWHGHGLAKQLWHTAQSHCPAASYTVRSSVFAVPVYQALGFHNSQPLQQKDGICFQPMIWTAQPI